MPASQREQALAPCRGEVAAGRVLQSRLEREELDLAASQQRLERVDVEAVVVGWNADQLGAGVGDRTDHRREARVLAGRDVAGAEDRVAGERQPLGGAVGDQDVVRVLGRAASRREARQLGGELGRSPGRPSTAARGRPARRASPRSPPRSPPPGTGARRDSRPRAGPAPPSSPADASRPRPGRRRSPHEARARSAARRSSPRPGSWPGWRRRGRRSRGRPGR